MQIATTVAIAIIQQVRNDELVDCCYCDQETFSTSLLVGNDFSLLIGDDCSLLLSEASA